MLQYLSGAARAYVVFLALALGAALGSFLNCAAWRVVRNESFLRGRSRCPDCGHTLGAPDLVPILSWIFLRGKCRYCGARVSARYPLTELVFALVTLLCVLRFDLTLLGARNLVFLACLYLLALTDLDAQLIPDGALLAAALVWAVTAPFLLSSWAEAGKCLLAALVYGAALLALSLVMDRVLGRDSLGGGDIKLFAVTGLYLGLAGTLFALLLACVLGILFALALRKGGREGFPFGPAIALSDALLLLWGGGLVNWYLGLLSL